ncbi:MAG: GspE/PulE family protein [Opitutaceae bacterium]
MTARAADSLLFAAPDEPGAGPADGVPDAWAAARRLGNELGLATVDLNVLCIPDAVRDLVPRSFAEQHQLVPIARHGKLLRVAIGDPFESSGLDSLRYLLGLDIEACLTPAAGIANALARIYRDPTPSAGPLLAANSADESTDFANEPANVAVAATVQEDAPVIKLVQAILTEAVRRRASDIHVEPLEKRLRVRYRIDGVLLEMENPPKRLQLAIISRLKILANISIAEKRLPQDGRLRIPLDGRSVDLRVSSLPTVHGESVVMRILDQRDVRMGLGELGFLPDDQAHFEALINLPNGLVLVTGPTGSGKTTTLYGCLHQLNQSNRKIITVEDPVEYQISGINQVQVHHETGMTFGSALRAMLRQAPNTVMVGEIRDLETAEIALNASLTGHMVFSTLHTNDAAGAVARLSELGVKPFLLAASLRAVVAQRLVRKICQHCRSPHVPSETELAALGLSSAQRVAATFLRGTGCPACAGTGYRGRIGIFEVLVINEEISQMIHERAPLARLRERARGRGMRTLREDGARKVIAGLTTIAEVVSMTVADVS